MALDFGMVSSVIKEKDRFVLTSHVNPDGDSLGSLLALSHLLKKMGKKATILQHGRIPENYFWIDPRKEILSFDISQHAQLIAEAEVIIVADTNQPARLRSLEPYVRQSNAIKIIIDHHLEPDSFADLTHINDEATSTGEIIYNLILSLDPSLLDREIATALYAAIMTDTGSFRFPRTDVETHTIAAHLLTYGVDPTETYSNIYESWSPGRMRLMGKMLDSMTTLYDGRLAYVVCTQAMFQQTETTEVETDAFTTYPMSVRGVQVGILFIELIDGVKISFRSKGAIPINELAKEFGGNGHKNAAGARIHDVVLDRILTQVLQAAEKYLSI